jgi:hypothetical protein
MNDMLSAVQYPYWLMVAGAVLVLLGFIGFAFSRNRNAVTDAGQSALRRQDPRGPVP